MKRIAAWKTLSLVSVLALGLTAAQAQEPQTVDDFKQRAFSRLDQKDYDGAIADFTEVIKRVPQWPGGYVGRSQCYLGKGDLKGAAGDFNEVVRLLPVEKAPIIYAMLATVLSSAPEDDLRDGARAVTLATKVCEFYRWEKPEALQTLAMAQAEKGDFAAAVKWQTKAIELAGGKSKKQQIDVAKARLELYKARKPCRESLTGKPPAAKPKQK